jgi:transcriptional regulator with XRE-family HTH domain
LKIDDVAINQRIGEVRKALGLTQKIFAEYARLSRTHLGLIEANQRKVNERIIKLICIGHGVNEHWLLTGSGEMFENFKDVRLKRIFDNFKKLDEYLQEYVLRQVDLYLEIQEKRDADMKKTKENGGKSLPKIEA